MEERGKGDRDGDGHGFFFAFEEFCVIRVTDRVACGAAVQCFAREKNVEDYKSKLSYTTGWLRYSKGLYQHPSTACWASLMFGKGLGPAGIRFKITSSDVSRCGG